MTTRPLYKTFGAADKATLFLRLFIGAILFTEAITKSQQFPMLQSEYPTILGIESAIVVSIVGILELFAGMMLTVGLLTRWIAVIMAVVMLAAAFIFFPAQSFDQSELKVVYAGIYVTLAISGGGRYALDTLIFTKRIGG